MTETRFMKMAIDIARQTIGQTSPNPVVGAVVVYKQHIVGIGAHLKAGEDHAEVHALRMAGQKAEGATVYVTLEPCSHTGRTPPCTDLLIQCKVKRVVIATLDPNPLVSGKGVQKLRAAGITVDVGLLEQEARTLNTRFFHYITTHTPYVTIKSATSLDGKIATATGQSQWITGPAAREDVHRYRHQHDAILVGVNTVIQDDPRLTTRLPEGDSKQPIRLILDSHLRTPLTAQVIQDKSAETWIITTQHPPKETLAKFQAENIQIISMPGTTINLEPLLKILGEHGITSVFVEGGAEVNGSFLRSGLFNQLILYMAPKLIGGRKAPAAFGGEGFAALEEALPLTITSVTTIDSDLKITACKKEKT
ncbi:riboflavin biosynthesis protein RibD [Pullulanibacillus camelliae]|uniref:Riboflavin biosynthesis protein RibD n=1 Tax=Pullulanibacillus camelliae TaxID=1707096 RepID=A0A8J2YID7_9BACL|nr:bifunctional diaminohydroxyphosphoribosylaminopyrimidine deaminase/5-amino-6-(5-phosphoribosylamino)uracil reductase RibD [Pullulanibacillus camelliae]GGE44112.1 riboflavin biosynthesis protein RibD [Pullulanibacillus camelliae]